MALSDTEARQPIHPDHAHPSDIGELLPVVGQHPIVGSSPGSAAAGLLARYECPCDGVLEFPKFGLLDNGSGGGPNTCDVKKNGTTMLASVMSVAHDDTDDTPVFGTFASAGPEVKRGDVITLVLAQAATNATDPYAQVIFRALGRAS